MVQWPREGKSPAVSLPESSWPIRSTSSVPLAGVNCPSASVGKMVTAKPLDSTVGVQCPSCALMSSDVTGAVETAGRGGAGTRGMSWAGVGGGGISWPVCSARWSLRFQRFRDLQFGRCQRLAPLPAPHDCGTHSMGRRSTIGPWVTGAARGCLDRFGYRSARQKFGRSRGSR